MSNILLSVVIPVYNVEKYLQQCVDSIINQLTDECEIILVDDGSPDGSGKICDRYANKDSRINVIHQQNGGLAAARNTGLDYARGEYVAFVDSFPMNAAGKILKYKMREDAVKLLNLADASKIVTA